MEALTGSVQLRAGIWRGTHHRASPKGRARCTRVSRVRTCAGDSIKETYTNIGKKKFDLNNTSWRKGGMESEKVDGPVTRLWKFFFRPDEGYVDRYGFSVPMGPLDDVRTSLSVTVHVLYVALLLMLYLYEHWQVLHTCHHGCCLTHAPYCMRSCLVIITKHAISCLLCREQRSRDRRQEKMLPEILPTLIKRRGIAGLALASSCW